MNFTGAGCLFCNDQYVLGGYQPRKQKPMISGLGGKKEDGEEVYTTALRETIEELFELETVPLEWIESIQQELGSRVQVPNGEYISIVYSFEDLHRILQILQTKGAQSPLYEEFPTNLLSLLFNRKQLDWPPEISHLVLLPRVSHPKDCPFVSPYFLKDIRLLLVQPSGPVDS